MHFQITFVIKTSALINAVLRELDKYIAARSGGMRIIEEQYKNVIDEIIRDIDIYYKLEINMDAEDDEADSEE